MTVLRKVIRKGLLCNIYWGKHIELAGEPVSKIMPNECGTTGKIKGQLQSIDDIQNPIVERLLLLRVVFF